MAEKTRREKAKRPRARSRSAAGSNQRRGATIAEGPTVLLSVEDGLAIITLNRPAQRNAISPRLMEELDAALAECARDSVRSVILTGAGTAFCGGMDLRALLAAAGQSHARHLADSHRLVALLQRLHGLPRPTIAAINGPAIAGGCGLATVCDFVLAVPSAKFGYTEVRIGFIPAIVSCYLVRQVGDRKARDLLLTGRIIEAAEALELGIINEVVPAEHLMMRARELAALVGSHSPESLRHTKALLQRLPGPDLGTDLERAAKASASARRSEDYREGLASFLEKRAPVWRSK